MCTNAAGKVTILFWDVDRRVQLGRWDADFDVNMLRMAFSPGGKRLAVGHGDGTIRIYDVPAQSVSLRLEAAHPGGVEMLRWLPDGRLLSSDIPGNSYTFWEPSGPPPASVLLPGAEAVADLAFSPDGQRLAVLRRSAPTAVVLVERASGRASPALTVPANVKPYVLCFRADGQQLTALDGRQAVVWDLPGRREKTYSLPGILLGRPAFLADGRLLVVGPQQQGQEVRLVIRDCVSGKEVGPGVTAAPDIVPPLLSADGRLLVTSGLAHDTIAIWDVQSGERAGELSLPDLGTGIMMAMPYLTPDGKWLYLHCMPKDVEISHMRLRVWDVANSRHCWDMPFPSWPAQLAISPDGRLIAVGYDNGSVEVWDVQEKELLFQWRPLGTGAVKCLAFTPDAAFLAVSGNQAPVQLLHLGELRKQLAHMGLDW